MTGSALRARVGAVRAVRSRGTARESAYILYAGALLAAVVFAPIGKALVGVLADSSTIVALTSHGAGVGVEAIAGGLVVVSLLVGTMRGPALRPPYETWVLAGADIPRRVTFRNPVGRALAATTLSLVVTAAVIGARLLSAGRSPLPMAVGFVIAAACWGIVVGVAWLVGQRLTPQQSRFAAVSVAVATSVGVAWPVLAPALPWAWVGASYPHGHSAVMVWPIFALLFIASCALATVGRILDGLSGPRLVAQAEQWATLGAYSGVGDMRTALAQLRPHPGVGRSWRAIRARSLAITFLVRDAVGAARTPWRCAMATLSVAGSALAWCVASTAPGQLRLPMDLAAAVVCFSGIGAWSDGLRHAAESRQSRSLYGLGAGRLIRLHLAFPVLAAVASALIGAGVAVAVGAPVGGALTAVSSAVTIVAVRVADSAKGTMPLALLAPISTPLGDFGGAVILLWQSDAVLFVAVTIGSTVAVASDAPLAIAVLAPVIAVAAGVAWWRLRRPR
ncbi:hypothetical protein [Galbitalea soli]|uniref:Uncharacterized protein n=1 Tax=Galbitalea soli TaxID=1268042 RepID=A0A7C9PP56_9MICO|nr:hypothetical protein [Galbitalea soli]NEM91888.1 hypothetical protein [Galbitalea soli]NYJ29276.1 hypothetical protein [Galbitalea soli]